MKAKGGGLLFMSPPRASRVAPQPPLAVLSWKGALMLTPPPSHRKIPACAANAGHTGQLLRQGSKRGAEWLVAGLVAVAHLPPAAATPSVAATPPGSEVGPSGSNAGCGDMARATAAARGGLHPV
jgi:hypothetical protein